MQKSLVAHAHSDGGDPETLPPRGLRLASRIPPSAKQSAVGVIVIHLLHLARQAELVQSTHGRMALHPQHFTARRRHDTQVRDHIALAQPRKH